MVKLILEHDDLIRAILIDIFARTGMRLEPKDVDISFIDNSDSDYGLCVDKVEIDIKK